MFRAGQQIGQYTIIEKLGKGGFGEVWLAEKRSQFIVKRVAVKLPHEEQVNFDAIRQEAMLWEAASGHPNVLPIIDADVYDGQVVIVSEYASGGSLHEKLKRESKLETKEAVEMTIGILNGLEFLHSRKIIHRDIKPQNILLQGNTPRLADFGISRAMQTTMVSSTIIGTDAYMSPEAFDGKRSVQTDIWSVGVVLYQMLKGSLPFPQEHPTERMFAVLTKDFEPLSNEFPSDLRRIIEKSLAKLPENRFQTCAEMCDELLKAHVPMAHPTLAKTEVFRIPIEPKIFDDSPSIEMDEEKETLVNNVPRTLHNPAPTLPAVHSESIATQFAQNPVSEVSKKDHRIEPKGAVSTNNSPIRPLETGNTKGNNFAKYIEKWGIYTLVAILLLFGIFIFTRPNSNSWDPFQNSAGKWGFRNWMGQTTIQPKYDGAYGFSNGLGHVVILGKHGFIDEDGNEVIPFKYDDQVKQFDGNYALMIRDNRRVRVDRNGNETPDIDRFGNSNINPNVSTYNTPASNKVHTP